MGLTTKESDSSFVCLLFLADVLCHPIKTIMDQTGSTEGTKQYLYCPRRVLAQRPKPEEAP